MAFPLSTASLLVSRSAWACLPSVLPGLLKAASRVCLTVGVAVAGSSRLGSFGGVGLGSVGTGVLGLMVGDSKVTSETTVAGVFTSVAPDSAESSTGGVLTGVGVACTGNVSAGVANGIRSVDAPVGSVLGDGVTVRGVISGVKGAGLVRVGVDAGCPVVDVQPAKPRTIIEYVDTHTSRVALIARGTMGVNCSPHDSTLTSATGQSRPIAESYR